jgi:CHAT domain-containing protein
VEALSRLAAPGHATGATGAAAARGAVLNRRWSGVTIAHFATHAIVDASRPDLSGLVLAPATVPAPRADGVLRIAEIYDLDFDVDLAVLSGCSTAAGTLVAGEGAESLARAFIHAGAARVIASLWPVDDRATAEFMQAFYASLLHGHRSPARALAAAQAALAARPRWAHPYYWGGFVLAGDWR